MGMKKSKILQDAGEEIKKKKIRYVKYLKVYEMIWIVVVVVCYNK